MLIKVQDSSFSTEFDGKARQKSTIATHSLANSIEGKCFRPSHNSKWENLTICNADTEINVVIMESAQQNTVSIVRIEDEFEAVTSSDSSRVEQSLSLYYGDTYAEHATLVGGYTYGVWGSSEVAVDVSYIHTGSLAPPSV